MTAPQQQNSVFQTPFPLVGCEGDLHGDNPRFKDCSDALFWNRNASLLMNEAQGHQDGPERMIGKPTSFEYLMTYVRNPMAPITVWNGCNHISKYGGPVAVRALKELVENPGDSEFKEHVVFEAATCLYRLGRGREIPSCFPAHSLTSAQSREVKMWLEAKCYDKGFEHSRVVAGAVRAVMAEPIEKAVAAVRDRIDLARESIAGALYRVGNFMAPKH